MNNDDFEMRMRSLEYYHSLRLVPGTWTVLRLDGRGFTKFTAQHFERPFDARFSDYMLQAAQAVLEQFQGIYAYTESDEISILFAPNWSIFDRELEKIISLSAALASATFSLACGEVASFDSRIWVGVTEQDVVDYFRWRQSDAARCALNGWAYWTLRKEGKNMTEATNALQGQTTAYKNELLFERGINFNEVQVWQRRGIGLYWENYDKEGFNPVTQERVMSQRRRIKIDRNLPMKDEYGVFVRQLIARLLPSE